MSAEWAPTDVYLTKRLAKMINRIDRITESNAAFAGVNISIKLGVLVKLIERGIYYSDAGSVVTELKSGRKIVSKSSSSSAASAGIAGDSVSYKIVKWIDLEKDILDIVLHGDPNFVIPEKIHDEINCEHNMHIEEEGKLRAREKLRYLQQRNGQPVVSGKWRKDAYTPRQYEFLNKYAVTTTVSEEEGEILKEQLITPLDGFLGQAYNYDDHGLTEEWMVSFKDGSSSASDADIIRTQIESLLEIMLVQVVDRVCTADGVLDREPLRLGDGAKIKEVPVWGIDCYTRRMVELAIEDRVSPQTLFNEKAVKGFIEKQLLPAINAQSADRAHNMLHAVKSIHERPVPSTTYDTPYAFAVMDAILEHGLDLFKVHPKGTGVICANPQGIAPHVMVSEYLGEIYPPYRWCERLDVVEQAQQTFGLKPTLPDFYNILLERPRQDPGGYGLLYVDASQKANLGSSCSHSCNSNCTSAVVARNGRLVIVLTTSRHIMPGEELTMDYYSITTSDVEWRAAICLCGQNACRGSFLHYATQDDLQQVLNSNCGPLWRYASLLRACAGRPLSESDRGSLDRHGMRHAAIGKRPQPWLQKFAADNLRFVEFERKALPCALMRPSNGQRSQYSFSAADMDARSVMEQRLQAMVCCFSMVQRVLARQPQDDSTVISASTCTSSSNTSSNTSSSTNSGCTTQSESSKKTGTSTSINTPYNIDCSTSNHNSSSSNSSSGNSNSTLPECEQGFEGKLPTRTVSAAEATERIWKYLSAVPSLMEEHCLCKTGAPLESAAVDKNLQKSEKSEKSAAVTAAAAAAALQLQQVTNAKRVADRDRINTAISEIRSTLKVKPKGLSGLKKMCLSLRDTVMTVSDLNTPKARLSLLCDVLILWAHTSNFSSIQEYSVVESDPLPVVARELGNNIPRMKILKPETRTMKRRGKEEVLTPYPVQEEGTSAEDLSLLEEIKELSNVNRSFFAKEQLKELDGLGREGCEISESILISPSLNCMTSSSLPSTDPSVSSSSFPQHLDESLSESLITDMTDTSSELNSLSSHEKEMLGGHTFVDAAGADDDSRMMAKTDKMYDGNKIQHNKENVNVVEVEGEVDIKVDVEVEVEVEVSATDSVLVTPECDNIDNHIDHGNDDSVKAGDEEAATLETCHVCSKISDKSSSGSGSGSGRTAHKESHQSSQFMDPNEPVYMGSKLYGKLFVFWQLIGWFNAGSDQKVEAPDLFGCVQLPLPAACFGTSETPYGAKQRAALMSHLREEKAQSMPWPSIIKACFSTAHVQSTVDGGSLLGSPMLDGALGQVASITNAMDVLFPPNSTTAVMKSDKTDISQFDSILPPEVPTSWVQCETCRKWRRVAWHVDNGTLPDLWDCSMNYWDSENASCDAPQDSYDPERESTLNYTSSEVHSHSVDYVIGAYRDVFCKKNRIFYEAQVKRLKLPKKESEKLKILFHFKGWSPKFDEWIEAGSDRISSHNLHTDPTSSDPRDQEKWQGVHGIIGTTSIAAAALKKKAEKDEEKLKVLKEKALKEKALKEQAAKLRKATASKKRSSSGRKRDDGRKRTKCDDVNDHQEGVIVIDDAHVSGHSVNDSGNTTTQASSTTSETEPSRGGEMVVVVDSDDDLWDDCYHQGMSP